MAIKMGKMMKNTAPQPIFLKDYTESAYLITHTELDFNLKQNDTETAAILHISHNQNVTQPSPPLILNGQELQLSLIEINGTIVPKDQYSFEHDLLTIFNPPKGDFKLKTIAISDPKSNSSLNGLYLTHNTYCTQCEAEGFRKITFYLDRPDILSTYQVRMVADKQACPILLSNGNLLEQGDLPDDANKHFAIWQDPHPKPSYLFALVAGDLAVLSDQYITADNREVALNIYVEQGKQNRATYAMGALKRSFKWDEDKFGCIYDLDIFNIVAVPHFNMGAMENKGLNIFNDKYILADEKTSTDADFEVIESIIGHEYFHNWTGNRITCRDWFQLCLKEGLTVYRDVEFTSDLRSRPVKRIDDVKALRIAQFTEDASPMSHPCRPESYLEINNFYSATVYRKGAEVVRILDTLVGKDGFRASMDYYFKHYDGQAATVKDFLYSFEQATKRDLNQFENWYSQAGTPVLIYKADYDSEKQQYSLTIEQKCETRPGEATKQPYHMPIKLGLLAQDGSDMPLLIGKKPVDNGMVELTKAKQTFIFEAINEAPILSFLRDFSVPVKVETTPADADILFLMAHDSDPFNRWQAGQTMAVKIILELMASEKSDAEILDGKFANALAKSLMDEGLEPAFKAQILTMPSTVELGDIISKDIDYQLIYSAREKLLKHLAEYNQSIMIPLYEQANEDQSFIPDANGAGLRAFRTTLLASLAINQSEADISRVLTHFKNANNMVDELAALSIINRIDGFDPMPYMADFYNKYQGNPQVLDKWFTLHARRVNADTLAQVKALTEHPNFSISLPNNVYALIGAFSKANPVEFNKPDGSGYDFLADMIIKLDGMNPQVASSLVTSFKSWRSLEPKCRQLSKVALEKILHVNNLSTNVYEIVVKSLGL